MAKNILSIARRMGFDRKGNPRKRGKRQKTTRRQTKRLKALRNSESVGRRSPAHQYEKEWRRGPIRHIRTRADLLREVQPFKPTIPAEPSIYKPENYGHHRRAATY